MKSDSFLLSKRMFSEKVSSYKNNRFSLEFKFKYLDFFYEIYYLRKIKILDLLFLNVKKYTSSYQKKKKIKFINFNKKDVVRHKLVSEIISAYEK